MTRRGLRSNTEMERTSRGANHHCQQVGIR